MSPADSPSPDRAPDGPPTPAQEPANGVGPFADMRTVIPVYAVLIGVAEALTSYADETVGGAVHALLLLALLNHHILLTRGRLPDAVPPPAADALLAISLLPLLGALSVALPLGEVEQLHQHVLIGLPFLLGIAQAARVLRLHRVAIGMRFRAPGAQTLVALAGIPLGLLGWVIAGPDRPIADFTAGNLVLAVLVLTLLSAFPEELALRGLVQALLARTYGRWCVVWSAALSATLYIGAFSAAFTVFAGAVAGLFGLVVWRTRSIAGVVAAHAILNVGLLMVWPEILG